MAGRVKIQPYLDSDALEKRYRNAQDGVERSQWQMIWLLSMGKTSEEVAQVTSYCVDWIRKIVRHDNPGQQRLLNAEQEAELLDELDTAAAGQAWSSVQVAAWMSAKLGRPIRQGRGWNTLQRLNFTTKTPRTRHAKADGEAQGLFKKSLS